MRSLSRVACAIAMTCSLLFIDGAFGQSDGAMTFRSVKPNDFLKRAFGFGQWIIYADGEIKNETGTQFEAYVTENNIPEGSSVYLNSPGGSVVGGLDFGTAIRRHYFNTYVGTQSQDGTPGAPGGCFSSCSLAFLGGVFRYMDEKSSYGIHRFSHSGSSSGTVESAQVVSGALVQYIKSMEVDPELFSLMTRTGATEIQILRRDELLRLNVINDGIRQQTWTLESDPQLGVYLRGYQSTAMGENKFLINCMNRKFLLYAIFSDAAEDVVQKPVDLGFRWLVTDGHLSPLNQAMVMAPKVVNGYINSAYVLSESDIRRISRAKTVGVGFSSLPDGGGLFFGFTHMAFLEGAKKLPGFLGLCRNK